MPTLEQELIDRGLVSAEDLAAAARAARESRTPLPAWLVGRGIVPEDDLLGVQADIHGLALVNLRESPAAEDAIRAVSAKLASHYAVVPVRFEGGYVNVNFPEDIERAKALCEMESEKGTA